MRIGGVEVVPPLVLAPMAGVTDSPMRRIVRTVGGCGLLTSEFISSEALWRDVPSEHAKLRFHPQETPIAIQIFGGRPEVMAAAARHVEAAGADICDINMGCPARKIVKGAAGVALMGDLELARRVMASVRAAVSIPVTVKIRSGLDRSRLADLELGRICETEGVDALTLHPRTARERYSGAADWKRIALLKAELAIPVIGNGDVRMATDAARMLAETGCDAVMIGRAAMVDPWIFPQAAALLAGGSASPPSLHERCALVRRHVALCVASYPPQVLVHRLKVLTRWFTRGLPGGRALRQQLSRASDDAELLAAIESFLSDCERLSSSAGKPPGIPER